MSPNETTQAQPLVATIAELAVLEGAELGRSDWQEMTQEQVDEFAVLTGDHNHIHVDPERAKASPFGGTIAHGYLTLSLLAPFSQEIIKITDAATSINYGLNKLRFPAPLPVGAQYRFGARLEGARQVPGGAEATVTLAAEVRDQDKPALVAECVFRYYA